MAFTNYYLLAKYSNNFNTIQIDVLVYPLLKGVEDYSTQDVGMIAAKALGNIMAEYANKPTSVIIRYSENDRNEWLEAKKVTIPVDRSYRIVGDFFLALIQHTTSLDMKKIYSESLINYLLNINASVNEYYQLLCDVIAILCKDNSAHKISKEEMSTYTINIVVNGIINKLLIEKLIELFNIITKSMLENMYLITQWYCLLSVYFII